MGSLRARAPYFGYRAAAAVANVLPGPVASVLARVAGTVLPYAVPSRRAMLARHLRRTTGRDLQGLALEWQLQRAFGSYARYWMESFRLARTTPAELESGMSWEGLENFEEAKARGFGVIMAMPHLGGWDFGGAWLASVGHPATVVVEALEPPELFEWFAGLRRSLGLTVVPHGARAGAEVLRALRANQLVGLVCDRDLEGNGVEVELFGERTTLPAGPATLALRTGAALLPTTVYFEGRGHRGVVRPPVPAERRGSFREDVRRVTQALAHELEAMIRAAPEQWHVLQPNWPSDREADGAVTGRAPVA